MERNSLLVSDAVREALSRLKSIILDVDGVLTDDTILMGPAGAEFKRFHVTDGLAIALLQKRLEIKVAILSGRASEATSARAAELKIEPCIQGQHDKKTGVEDILAAHGVAPADAAFVGNEILDLGAFAVAGLKVAVADAAPQVRERADLVLSRGGGQGAVRELFELICEVRGIDFVGWYE